MKQYTQKVTAPTAFVTKDRQRVKQYNNDVYLKNGNEFELELFNPTTSKVLAKISLNGSSLGSGIVLRPGERVFLERYFDDARKFVYETYVIDGADANAKEATKYNGLVEVEFFTECVPLYYANNLTYTYTNSPNWTYGCGTAEVYSGSVNCTSNSMKSCSDSIGVYNCSYVDSDKKNLSRDLAPEETGRIEKGSNSNQEFNWDSTTFNTYYSWKTTWTIIPESNKPLLKEDLKVFCTSCGTKRRKTNHRFCPNCGTKF